MGRLIDLQIPTVPVETPGGAFAVRGLSLEDIVNLYNEHTAQAGTLFDQFNKWAAADGTGEELPPLGEFVAMLISQAPVLAARVIAKAADADSPEGLAMARRLPPLAQTEALEKIGHLTFRSEEDVKKMAALMIRYAKNLVQALLRASSSLEPSVPGSGLFEQA